MEILSHLPVLHMDGHGSGSLQPRPATQLRQVQRFILQPVTFRMCTMCTLCAVSVIKDVLSYSGAKKNKLTVGKPKKNSLHLYISLLSHPDYNWATNLNPDGKTCEEKTDSTILRRLGRCKGSVSNL